MGAIPELDERWIHLLAAAARSGPPKSGTRSVQAIWNDFRSGGAACPADEAPLALLVTPKDGKEHHAFRFCCVTCGWSTPPFVVCDGIAEAS